MSQREKKEFISAADFWGVRKAISCADFKKVKKAVATLPKIDHSESAKKNYELRCTELRLALKHALNLCALHADKSGQSWEIVLYINHTLCRDFPASVKYHIENYTQDHERYTLLAYDNIPEQLLSQTKYTPFDSLWQTIFIVHKDLLKADGYKISSDFLYLAQTFRAMGWGREIPLELTSFEKYLKKSLPESGLAVNLVLQKQIKGVLSQLIQSLKAGKEAEEAEHKNINEQIIEQTSVPNVVSDLVCGYLGFFTAEKDSSKAAVAPVSSQSHKVR